MKNRFNNEPIDDLPIVVLNDPGTEYQAQSPPSAKAIDAFMACVETGRQSFPWAGRSCELQLRTATDYGVISFRLNEVIVGLGAVVWEEFGPESIWENLVAQHNDRVRQLRLPTSPAACPDRTPWLALSFSPRFLANESPEFVNVAVSAMWGVALAVYRFRMERSLLN